MVRRQGPIEADVLVVEDDEGMRRLLSRILRDAGWSVAEAGDGREGLAAVERGRFGLVVTDLKMPRMDGMELLRRLRETRPSLPVVVLTAHGTVSGAVEAMKLGAFDFLTKPLSEPAELRDLAARAMSSQESHAGQSSENAVVAEDPTFHAVLDMARIVAERDTTVLLLGESGVGKDVLARFIHSESSRSKMPFVAVNCAAIPSNLIESELFGHEKGAFTGATRRHQGHFERASGGTLFLDEVAELPLDVQATFLRVLEDHEVRRVGGSQSHPVDVRVVAATNQDLEGQVEKGTFRRDLYFRLAVFPIRIPPLRHRLQDIVPLARHFLSILSSSPGRAVPRLSPAAEQALLEHHWPGNVRELQNVVERAVILSRGDVIEPEHLGLSVSGAGSDGGAGTTLKAMERRAIARALEAEGGNRRRAAKRLGIALRTLQYKIREYDLK